MIPITQVSDHRFQLALGRECPVCEARRGELCGDDEGVCEERLSANENEREGTHNA